MSVGTQAAISFRVLLAIRPVRNLWSAQTVSVFGDALAMLAVFGLVTFEMHGTAVQLTMLLVAYFAPVALISPVAGVYVDRWDAKRTMIVSDLLRGVLVLVLLVARDLFAMSAVLCALSVVSSFFVPAQAIAIKRLVPSQSLMRLNAVMTQSSSVVSVVAPSAAGLLVRWFGANICFALDSATFFLSAALIRTLPITREGAKLDRRATSLLQGMGGGLRFVLGHRTVALTMVAMAAGMLAIRCFGSLLALHVRDVLHAEVALFGTLNALIGVGIIACTQWLHRLVNRISEELLVVCGLGLIAIAALAMAFFPRVTVTAISMFGLGAGAACILAPTQTIVQRLAPPNLLGRVSSTRTALLALAQVLALFIAGPVAEQTGLRSLYLLGAAGLVLTGIVCYVGLGGNRTGVPAATGPSAR